MVSNGFLQSEVLGEVSVLEGGSSGRSFSRSLPRKFSTKFSALFCWDIQSKTKKNFSKNFTPKFPWPCTAKTGEKFQGTKLHDEVLHLNAAKGGGVV